MDGIPERIDSKFRYVLLAAQRAEQIMHGASARIETSETKPTRIGMEEIKHEAVGWDYGPAPATADSELLDGPEGDEPAESA